MDQQAETAIEIKDMFRSGLGRDLNDTETEILNSILESGKERRVAFLKMMKELFNKNNMNHVID